MRTLIAMLTASLIAAPALAGDYEWPREPNDQTTGYAAPKAPATPAKSWVDEPWGYTGGGPGTTPDPRPYELAEQIKRNDAHARRTYDAVIEAGGCDAVFVPFEYASYCNRDVFGDPMGSQGGGD